MKSKILRGLLAVLGIGALMLALVTVHPANTAAANLTGGQYTYLIDGEETTFTFDPVVRKDGSMLLPTEVFQSFGINIDGATTKNVTLSKAGVTSTVTIGSLAYNLDGHTRSLTTVPLRLNGRVFLPSDLIKDFGIDIMLDGNFVSLRSYTDESFQVKQLSQSEWNGILSSRGFNGFAKADSGVNLFGEYYMFTKDMITASNLDLTYGERARLLGLLKTNTLVLIKLSNLSNKAGGLVTTSTYLIDDKRNQYDVKAVIDIGYGLLNEKLAPSADRYGVLVFDKLSKSTANAIFWYDNTGSSLGTFRVFE